MIRILWRLIFFILPFIVFWFYVRFAEGYRKRYGQGFYASHWYWVAFIGLLMFAASLVALWAWGDRSVSGTYVPPHVVNGKVVPGEFTPEPAGRP